MNKHKNKNRKKKTPAFYFEAWLPYQRESKNGIVYTHYKKVVIKRN